MIYTFRSDEEFTVVIEPLISGKKVIALDGVEGVGKSEWFSEKISKARNGLPIIHIDQYVKRQKRSHGFYILKSRKSLISAIESHKTGIIVEGLFVKKILDQLSISTDLWIYLKKMAVYGWSERDWLDKELTRDYPPDLSFHLTQPRNRQHYAYHMKYSPQISADLVVEINEDLYK